MSSKFIDTTAIIQVIGSIFKDPSLLDQTDKYFFQSDDFENELHKVIFGSIYKLYESGVTKLKTSLIEDFLKSRPRAKTVFEYQKGAEWIEKASSIANKESFDYFYNRMKKMTLLRMYATHGIDVTWLYDPDNILDAKKKQEQEELLDNLSLAEIAAKVNDKLEEIKNKYVDNSIGIFAQAGEGIEDLIDSFKVTPEVGIPLYGGLINSVTRGARLKKFYLRSAPSGVGKSRSMIADVCTIGCKKIYDDNFGWIDSGSGEPVLYITTEQELNEIQTMMLAFLSNVNEEHILNGRYENNEEDRVREAAKILTASPIYIEELPDFSLMDIENCIKRHVRDHGILYVAHDYIHTSLKILEEISKRSGGIKLREDNILFMLSIRLKDLCNQYGIFILSATQLSADWKDSNTPDQNLLRGAKSIADKIDYGSIILPVNDMDRKSLEAICNSGMGVPNLKISVYKNRRGRYKSIYIWCRADLGTCRITPIFATDWSYELIQIDELKINVTKQTF